MVAFFPHVPCVAVAEGKELECSMSRGGKPGEVFLSRAVVCPVAEYCELSIDEPVLVDASRGMFWELSRQRGSNLETQARGGASRTFVGTGATAICSSGSVLSPQSSIGNYFGPYIQP